MLRITASFDAAPSEIAIFVVEGEALGDRLGVPHLA